jgi:hypothetical protein
MEPNSSTRKGSRTLAASEVREILLEFVNLRDDVNSGVRLMRNFAGIVPGWEAASLTPESINDPRRARGLPPAANAATLIHQIHMDFHEALLPTRDALRKIWTEREPISKRWAVLHLAEKHYDLSSSKEGATRRTPTPMSQVLEYLLRANVHTSICANPECPTPYFFPSRPGRKYCEEKCAGPAQREFKRRWWREHGKAWRKQRKSKKASKKGK